MTTSPLPKEPVPIRLVFKLERAEHPRLYDELIRFHKGVKRVNRLRVLAYDGLLAQHGLIANEPGSAGRSSPDNAQQGSPDVTNDLFAPVAE